MDLGPGHALLLNYYTIRHDGSTDFPRSWVMQVRAGGEGLVLIDCQSVGRPLHLLDAIITLSPLPSPSLPSSLPLSPLPSGFCLRLLRVGGPAAAPRRHLPPPPRPDGLLARPGARSLRTLPRLPPPVRGANSRLGSVGSNLPSFCRCLQLLHLQSGAVRLSAQIGGGGGTGA